MNHIDELITDDVILDAFHNTNFGRSDFRTILAETVMKRAAGYHAGYTATTICEKLKLIGGKRQAPTKLGFKFAFSHYYKQKVRDVFLTDDARGS